MKKFLLFLCISLAIAPTFQSCRLLQPIQVVSPYNAALVADIKALGMEADGLYTTMESETDKTFDTYSTQYNSLEVLSNSIVATVEAMPKNTGILKQATIVQAVVLDYKSKHKAKGKLNNSEIRSNKIYFKDHLKPLLVSATALK